MSIHKEKATKVLKVLRKAYPDIKPSLVFRNPLQLLVATILSAQCTDERVNSVTKPLFKKYPTVSAYAHARISVFEADIRSTGFYRNKARNIIKTAKKIITEFKGKVPDTMEALLSLPGVARKTANIVLYHGFNKAEGIAVDTHVKRLSNRIGFSSNSIPDKIEKDLRVCFTQKVWGDINGLLIYHGRKTCKARNPQCPTCVIGHYCSSYGLFI